MSRVWCVKRVLVDWNSLNYCDWKEGRRESTSLYNTRYIQFIHEHITFHQPDKSSAECNKVVCDNFGKFEFLMKYQNMGLYAHFTLFLKVKILLVS